MRCQLPRRHDGPCLNGDGWDRCEWVADAWWGGESTRGLTVGHDAWWTIHGEELAAALNRVANGQRPSTVYAELYANTERTA